MNERETVTVWYGTFSPNVIRVHNNNHAHTLRESCPICQQRGNVWVREGMPQVTDAYV